MLISFVVGKVKILFQPENNDTVILDITFLHFQENSIMTQNSESPLTVIRMTVRTNIYKYVYTIYWLEMLQTEKDKPM